MGEDSSSSTPRGTGERIHEVKFEYIAESPYIRPLRMTYTRNGSQLFWDMGLGHDSVMALLYHREKKCILLVRQFRPAVFVQLVRRMRENLDKALCDINWPAYPIEIGNTLELCGGIMDKMGKSPEETVREEIEEECGYSVREISLVKKYLTGVGMEGCSQNLYYAEIDESMKITEGGGNWKEGEVIEKVFLSIPQAKELLGRSEVHSASGLLYALSWFFASKTEHSTTSDEANAIN